MLDFASYDFLLGLVSMMESSVPVVKSSIRYRHSILRSDVCGVWRLLTNSKTNLLLACLPAGWVTHFIGLSDIATFTLV